MAPAELPPSTEVALAIYDLSGTKVLNDVTRLAGIGGAFHVAVQVYGVEWSYGRTPRGSGVYPGRVGQSWPVPLRERVVLGQTTLPHAKVRDILNDLKTKWQGTAYHPLRHNCGHFSAAFVKLLRVEEAPVWLNALANMGETLFGSLGDYMQPLSVAYPQLSAPCSCSCGMDEAYDAAAEAREERQWRWAMEKMKTVATCV